MATDQKELSQLTNGITKNKDHCNVCGDTEKRLLRCARCKKVFYCGPQHQKEDWKTHKASCVPPPSAQNTSGRTITPLANNKNCDPRQKLQQQTTSPPKNANSISSPKSYFMPLYSVRDYDMNIDDYVITPSPARLKLSSEDITHRENVVKRADYLVEKMTQDGYCVIDNYLGESRCGKVLWDVVSILRAGIMKPGQIVSKINVRETVRGDKIAWITGAEEAYENMKLIMSEIDRLIRYCTGRLGSIKGRTPAMVACYPGDGTGYKRHIDNTINDGRKVTCLYYLNKGWDSEEMGGKLRMFPQGSAEKVDVDPISDRLVVFWSDRRTPHEVLPAYSQRFAVTLWYFDAEEREQVKEKYFSNLKNAFASNVQVTTTEKTDDSEKQEETAIRVPASIVFQNEADKSSP